MSRRLLPWSKGSVASWSLRSRLGGQQGVANADGRLQQLETEEELEKLGWFAHIQVCPDGTEQERTRTLKELWKIVHFTEHVRSAESAQDSSFDASLWTRQQQATRFRKDEETEGNIANELLQCASITMDGHYLTKK